MGIFDEAKDVPDMRRRRSRTADPDVVAFVKSLPLTPDGVARAVPHDVAIFRTVIAETQRVGRLEGISVQGDFDTNAEGDPIPGPDGRISVRYRGWYPKTRENKSGPVTVTQADGTSTVKPIRSASNKR